MPLVRIDVLRGRPPHELTAIGSCVHQAMVTDLGVPERDHFQIVTEHDRDRLLFDRSYLDIDRSDGWVLVHVTLAAGRSTESKQAFYSGLCERLTNAVGLRREDLAVVLVENDREDWSFGHGEANYLTLPPGSWR
jgi:phenylpyruvate tautomerase PptA (4-oxalocrotonate tautomerase family)